MAEALPADSNDDINKAINASVDLAQAQALPTDPNALPPIAPAAAPQLMSVGAEMAAAKGQPMAASPELPTLGASQIQKSLLGGFEKQQQAAQAEAGAIGKAAQAEVAAVQNAQKQMDAFDAQRAQQEKVRQEQLKQQTDKISEAQKAYSDAKIDGTRFWQSRETGQKVLMGVSLFLGAFGGEGGNKAAEYMEKAIQRDIDLQKAELGKREGALQSARGIYGDMLRRFGDERQAELASKLMINDKLQLELQKAAAGAKGPIAQAQAQKGMAILGQQADQLKLQFAQAAEQKAALSGLLGGSAEAAQIANLSPELRKEYGGRIINAPGIAKGVASSEKEAEKFRESYATFKSADDSIKQLAGLGRKYGKEVFKSEAAAEAKILQSTLVGQLRLALTGPGAMTDSDRKFLEDMIADPTAVFTTNANVKLAKLQAILKNQITNQAKSLGLKQSAQLDKRPAI